MDNERTRSLTVYCILAAVLGLPVLSSAKNESVTNPQTEQHFKKANELRKAAEYDAAVAEFEKVISASPKGRIAQNAQYWIGQSHFGAGQFDAALVAFRGLADEYPTSAIIPSTQLMIGCVEQSKEEKTLVEAIEKGDIEQLKLLISEGADVNAKVKVDLDVRYKEGWTLLNLAAWHGHADIAALLINKGADVNTRMRFGITPLWYAAEQGHLDAVELLISRGANIESPLTWGTRPLHKAAGRGHLDVVELLISKGADIEARDWRGRPLHSAASLGHLDVVELLISKGANIEARGWRGCTPLNSAADGGHHEVVKLLLKKGAWIHSRNYIDTTPLHLAISVGDQGMVELLLAHGASPWRRHLGLIPVGLAMRDGQKEMTKFLIDKGFGHSEVHVAAFLGDTEEVKRYLAAGGEINVQDQSRFTLLDCAIFGGQIAEAEFLINKGANINLKGGMGCTALHWAARKGHTEITGMLLDKGADMTIRSELGGTPLYLATCQYHKDVVEMMLLKGANVNAGSGVSPFSPHGESRPDEGSTPLHIACGSWMIYRLDDFKAVKTMVELLIAHGADVNAKTKNGETPMSVAKERGYDQVVELLRKHGAKE